MGRKRLHPLPKLDKKYGSWKVIRNFTIDRCIRVKCVCGKEKELQFSNLYDGKTKSCGCLDKNKGGRNVHGCSTTNEFKIWTDMKRRCNNPNGMAWKYYGERGIKVCRRWLKFKNFLKDMGLRPSKNFSLDRYPDNNGNYEPSNCRWATREQQARNRRSRKKSLL